MRKKIVLLLVSLALLIAGCMRYEYAPEQSTLVCPDGTVLSCPVPQETSPFENFTGELTPIGEVEESIEGKFEDAADVIVMEGDLVKLEPKVSDADGDKITISYSKPLNSKGEWQTKVGDAGVYTIIVTASDSKSDVTKKVVILVKSANALPVINIVDEFRLKEGEKILLSPEVTDPDGEELDVTFSGWMDSNSYKTTYEDAGEHKVVITASDGVNTVTKTVKIIVENVNRKPMLKLSNVNEGIIEVTEGEEVEIIAVASDEDGNDVTIEFSEPLDKDGKWQTEAGDAGEYDVEVTASDGTDTAIKEALIIVKSSNQPPVFEEIGPIVLNVGENLQDYLKPAATDPEGEDVLISYSGWLEEIDYEVTEEDAGEHTLTVHYSDGTNEVTQDVTVTVNRPPIFEI